MKENILDKVKVEKLKKHTVIVLTNDNKKNKPFIIPENYSTWNSIKIFNFWSRFTSRQNSKLNL
ncbi:MAG: hypothetical protein ABF289_10070 [Clostridiales bacterium]